MKALIDGDIILYRATLACEEQCYRVYIQGAEEFGPIEDFRYKRDADKYIAETSEEALVAKPEGNAVSPLNAALYNIKNMVNTTLSELRTNNYELILGSGRTFRHDVCSDYKAGRSRRPIYKEKAVEYMVKHLGAKVVKGIETDDYLGINQRCDTSIVSVDKDLLMIPGSHYNPVKKVSRQVSDREGMEAFYQQMLVGDATDNIQGIPGIGVKKAAKIDPNAEAVIDIYMDHYGDHVYEAIMNKTAKLLWILRHEDDIEMKTFMEIVETYDDC